MEAELTFDELQRRIADQDRRLGEALRILKETRRDLPQDLLVHVAREFDRLAELTVEVSMPTTTFPAGVRA